MNEFRLRWKLSSYGYTEAMEPQRWSEGTARRWYAKQPWLVGTNYIPATAINQLEMWQADTFDPQRIDTELGWASSLGMNTVRVFLHDLLWLQDASGFSNRIDAFLRITDRHKMRPMLVLFDSCWNPFPQLGEQPSPGPGVHNSGWVQGPGADALKDPTQHSRLEAYVKGVVGKFARDERILAWDVWNEPDNLNMLSYGAVEPPDKVELVLALLPKVFQWARAAAPMQPLTSAVWNGCWSTPDTLTVIERIQLQLSDVLSFHSYDEPEEFKRRLQWLQGYGRPILCTEYLARQNRCTFQETLPILQNKIAAYNWGLVAGKTQTNLPWDSWENPYTDREPANWFHDIFRSDGKPYRTEEVDFIKEMTRSQAESRTRSRHCSRPTAALLKAA
jgi:hypothetical protein